jgi:hypothetical protein
MSVIVPDGQGVQDDAPAAEVVPRGHTVQGPASPYDDLYVFSGQFIHVPIELAFVLPGGHKS